MSYSIGKTPKLNTQPLVNFSRTQNTSNVNNTDGINNSTTVNFTQNKNVDLGALDKTGFYNTLGVNISTKPQPGSVDSYAQVGRKDFGRWNSENFAFTPEGKKEAVDYLGAYNNAIKDYNKVAPHFENSLNDLAAYMLT